MGTTFGKTWWGKQWLNSLNNIDYSNRLPRGASYARKGAVKKITINGNRIKAKVAGSRSTPYNVDIIIPPFFNPELGNFLKDIQQHPVIISKLLNRELDPLVLELAERSGLTVFPRQWSDLKMSCSCPDWAVPCKHLASVIYKVSAEIDNNPFLVFELHNVDLPGELAKSGVVINSISTDIPRIKEMLFEKAGTNTTYNPELAYQKLNFSGLEPLHESLTALLLPMPAFYTASAGDFRDKYLAIIKRVVKNTQRAVSGKVPLPDFFTSAYSDDSYIGHRSKNKVMLDEDLQVKVFTDEKELTINEFLQQLSHIPVSRTSDFQPSTVALHTALNLALQLTANGAIMPQIVQLPDNKYFIRWIPAILSKKVSTLCNELESILPPDVFASVNRNKMTPVNKNRVVNLLSVLITEIVHLASSEINNDLFQELFFKNTSYAFSKPGEESLAGGIMAWLRKFYLSQGDVKPVFIVEESGKNHFRIKINVQLPEGTFKNLVSLKSVLNQKEFEHRRYEILQTLALMSNFIDGLDDYINSSGKKEIIMDSGRFAHFLMKMVPAIQLLDIPVLLPKSLQKILKPKPSIKLKSKGKSSGFLRIEKLLDFEWQVALGDKLMSETEFKQLLLQSEGLIRFKTNYIYVAKEELEKLYKQFTSSKQLSSFQLMRAALSGEYQGSPIVIDSEVEKLIHELTSVNEMPLPKELKAQLRPYQHRGFSWIYRNARVGFGSVLADDMGLGKTIQVITTILKFKEEGYLDKEKALVVAPTGLLTNWLVELQKFAPTLQAEIYHGQNRNLEKTSNYDVLITSYGVMRTDADILKRKKWHIMIIDEAQNIKNNQTAQAKAVKSIKAENFVAMSGTPVENRLSELWSIMDYCNRSFLGSTKEFAETYGNPIEQLNDSEVANKLKKVTAPFLMRRLKSDKSIISDLPDKVEIDSFASLTKEQASLYKKTLEKAMLEIEGIQSTDQQSLFVRQGLVLQMILALKQICNHPAQFLKNGDTNPTLSGKIALLFDKLDSIVDSNEKVLIFTQFTEMGRILEQYIEDRYGDKPLYYHGKCSLNQRKEMVERFQTNHADKIFLLSLRAAGTGLNLTAASHVIHYDLWWNPAVEAQATDRAYRIGQKNNVMVHRFITKNTFEERINEMIQQKKALAEMTVSTGENWIGNLTNKELRDIFNLQN